MTKVQAIVREQQVEAIIERLLLIGIRGLTVFGVRGTGRGTTHREVFRGNTYQVNYAVRLCIEWIGRDKEADAVVRAIQSRAATGAEGDGEIFVIPIEGAVRIRTGERDEDAI
jgi:nitrogen regulatory protein P-II 1